MKWSEKYIFDNFFIQGFNAFDFFAHRQHHSKYWLVTVTSKLTLYSFALKQQWWQIYARFHINSFFLIATVYHQFSKITWQFVSSHTSFLFLFFPSNLLKIVCFCFSVRMQSITLDDCRGSFFFSRLFPLLLAIPLKSRLAHVSMSRHSNMKYNYFVHHLFDHVWNDLTFDCFKINCIAVIVARLQAWKWLVKATANILNTHTHTRNEWMWHFSVKKMNELKMFQLNLPCKYSVENSPIFIIAMHDELIENGISQFSIQRIYLWSFGWRRTIRWL